MIPLTIIFLEQKEGGGSAIAIFKQELINLVKKPIIVAPILGIVVAITQLPLPHFFISGLNILGAATSPVALFTLGLMMTKFKFKLSLDSIIIVVLKLIIQPLSALLFILWFGLKSDFAAEIIILTAMPTAIIVSMFAEKYELYQEETVSAIIGSNILSILTLVAFTMIANKFI
jgi:predicted permease